MNLAVSNIAWEPAEDDAIAALLRREEVKGIELAPTKWRERPYDAAPSDIVALREKWHQAGLRIVSLQSLLFGRADLQLFGDDATRVALADYLRRVIDFAALLGAGALVFGSPKNRMRGALPMADAMNIATEFFRGIGEHAHANNAALCIEANPPGYGCDFITTTLEAADLCRCIDHPGIRVNADLGGMAMSGEDPKAALKAARGLIGHVHASEPNLAELGAQADHASAADGLRAIGYDRWVSIEMRAAGDGRNIAAVERAVKLAKQRYLPS